MHPSSSQAGHQGFVFSRGSPGGCREREAKESYKRSQGRTVKGYMRMATTSLEVLNRLSSDTSILEAFLRQPLVGRAAYSAMSFVDNLAGPQFAALQVCARPPRPSPRGAPRLLYTETHHFRVAGSLRMCCFLCLSFRTCLS